jgi:hypothetical protein
MVPTIKPRIILKIKLVSDHFFIYFIIIITNQNNVYLFNCYNY